ncbi:MAG: hypothetical protein GF353_24020 [Candidatus Lokiarchaeota archaeon]|nr:hypothetical protein [Candidatus Lokiarchaeota archaeon]
MIKPISKNHGNIFGILHHHDKKINNMIPVSITFEVSERLRDSSLKKIREELEEKNIEIEDITFGGKQRQLITILTGHVFDTDVVDTIKRLASKNIKVTELEAKFTEITEISNVKLKVSFPESMQEEDLINELNLICEEKNLFLIRS